MSIGDVVQFSDGSYEIRAIVDGRYVVRIRYRKTGVEKYMVWSQEDQDTFNLIQARRFDKKKHASQIDERNQQIYRKNLSGITMVSLGNEYGISVGWVRQIIDKEARKEKNNRK